MSFFVFGKEPGDLPRLITSSAIVGVGQDRVAKSKRGRLIPRHHHGFSVGVDASYTVPVFSPDPADLQGNSATLTSMLATALGLDPVEATAVLKTHSYILTLDFLLKLLYIHERRESLVPTILMVSQCLLVNRFPCTLARMRRAAVLSALHAGKGF